MRPAHLRQSPMASLRLSESLITRIWLIPTMQLNRAFQLPFQNGEMMNMAYNGQFQEPFFPRQMKILGRVQSMHLMSLFTYETHKGDDDLFETNKRTLRNRYSSCCLYGNFWDHKNSNEVTFKLPWNWKTQKPIWSPNPRGIAKNTTHKNLGHGQVSYPVTCISRRFCGLSMTNCGPVTKSLERSGAIRDDCGLFHRCYCFTPLA